MLTVLKRLKEKPDDKWEFHEIMNDWSPGGTERELDWAGRYKKRNKNPKWKHEYRIELT
jgi:hypothetical protein